MLALQSLRAAKKLHIPIISHSHTLPDLTLPRMPHFINVLAKKVLAVLYRKYDGLISPSEFLQKKFDDCHFTMKEAVIGNGVDTAIFYPGETSIQNTFNIVYVGRLDPGKNLSILLEALHILHSQKKLHENVHCVVVG